MSIAFLLTLGFVRIGGYKAMTELYPSAVAANRSVNTTCGLPPENAFHLFRHPVYDDNPWPGILLQASLGCLWYWCADQVLLLNKI